MSSTTIKSVQGYPIRPAGEPYIPRRAVALQHLATWKQAGDWVQAALGTGLQKLVLIGLPGQPAAEMLPMTAEMWREALPEDLDEEIDLPRIQKAFRRLNAESRQWPLPVDFLAQLPPRRHDQRTVNPAPPQPSEQQHQDGRERLQEILDGLK